MSIFDTCGLKPLSTTKAGDMKDYFKKYNASYDPIDGIGPHEIFISKNFMQNMIDDMDEQQNCLRLSLGLRKEVTFKKPSLSSWFKSIFGSGSQSKEVPLSWMIQAVKGSEVVEDGVIQDNRFHLENEGVWYVTPLPPNGHSPVTPQEIGVPPYEQ